LGAFEGDRRVEPAKQGRAATQQDRDHVHADLIDQAERECLLHDGRAMQTDDLVARRALGLVNRANDAVSDERIHGWVRRGRLVVRDHEAWGSADGAAIAPTTVALILVKSLATHHDGADAIEHFLQDGQVLIGRRAEHPVVQHPSTVAEWVLTAVIRTGDVPIERGGNVADHERDKCFLSVLPHWPIQPVLTYTDDNRRHFSSASPRSRLGCRSRARLTR
jgi:hypothetical protein